MSNESGAVTPQSGTTNTPEYQTTQSAKSDLLSGTNFTPIDMQRAAEIAALAAGYALLGRPPHPIQIEKAVTDALAQLEGDRS
ncbi:MAG: hypothetical protein ED559_10095 [Phycisphaera sp.]|nr:MAG: hypothetical protein ED559_10095 [Phycisphaera sp.]